MSSPLFDSDAELHTTLNADLLVPWLLMAAYAYEVEGDPILSDAMFDTLARRMAAEYDTINHFHKHLIPRPEEGAATVHIMLTEKTCPSRVAGAVNHLRSERLRLEAETSRVPA